MRVFQIFELVVVGALLYFIGNLVRYFFFKESGGGNRMFSLSDKWIEKDKKNEETKGKK